MNLTRRSFLSFLGVAPVAGPEVARSAWFEWKWGGTLRRAMPLREVEALHYRGGADQPAMQSSTELLRWRRFMRNLPFERRPYFKVRPGAPTERLRQKYPLARLSLQAKRQQIAQEPGRPIAIRGRMRKAKTIHRRGAS